MDTSTALRYLYEQHRQIASEAYRALSTMGSIDAMTPRQRVAVAIIEANEQRDTAALVKLAAEWQAVAHG